MSENILNDYVIDIYLATDNANEEKIKKYFGNNLKSYILLDKNDIEEPFNCDYYIKEYLNYFEFRKNNPDKFPIVTNPRKHYVYTYYKLYCAYYLMKKYETNNNIKYDLIIKHRLDGLVSQNLYNFIKKVDDSHICQLFLSWEVLLIGKRNIMEYICKLFFIYGKYNYGENIHNEKYLNNIGIKNYHDLSLTTWPCWSESPEVQLYEHIKKYINENNFDDDIIISDNNIWGLVSNRK